MADQNPSLTLGIPVYNGMPYLRECMESVLTQSYPDFEVLIVLDEGADGSFEYLKSLSDQRIRLIAGPRKGLVAALNLLLEEARSKWLVRQDADDVSYPTRLATIAQHIKLYPETGVFFSRAEYYPPNRSYGSFRSSHGSPEELRDVVKAGYLLAICHPSAVLNVARVREVGGYQEGSGSEDSDLWWRVALKYDVRFMPTTLVGYRLHAHSKMAQALREDAVSGLYVQYRLLSWLRGRKAQPLEVVEQTLDRLVSSSSLRAKEYIRTFNMRLNDQRYVSAVIKLLAAVLVSPTFVFRRIFDEIAPTNVIRNGINPSRLLEAGCELWPE